MFEHKQEEGMNKNEKAISASSLEFFINRFTASMASHHNSDKLCNIFKG